MQIIESLLNKHTHKLNINLTLAVDKSLVNCSKIMKQSIEKMMSAIDEINGIQVSSVVSTTIQMPNEDPVTESHECMIKVSTDTKSVTYVVTVDGETYEFNLKKSWLKKLIKAIMSVAELMGSWKRGITFKKIK